MDPSSTSNYGAIAGLPKAPAAPPKQAVQATANATASNAQSGGLRPTLITKVECFVTRPDDSNLVLVKVYVDHPTVRFGWGCATFNQRALAVKTYVDEYIAPLVVGRDANNIEDIWQVMHHNSYWRNGPVGNNSISGIDMALWDIKGKIAGLPCYQLWGGKARDAIVTYSHAKGDTTEELFAEIDALMARGHKHVRCQPGVYGGGDEVEGMQRVNNPVPGAYFDQDDYMHRTIEMFKAIREKYGRSVHILHDVHERLYPAQAIAFAKALEPYNPFWIEDIFSPEQAGQFANLRNHSTVPLAMGELFSNPMEYRDLIVNRQIDFIRCHISDIGGITPALKLGHFCAAFGVRIGWHGPPDMSAMALSANLNLNIHLHNAAIHEYCYPPPNTLKVFPDHPFPENGYLYPIDRPGLGITVDEEAVRSYPARTEVQLWTQARLPDGTLHSP